MLRKVPLIVILGSTGTGKTRLSLELGERFGCEIISADSMQVYSDLNVVTAKASTEEQSKVRHHLLDVEQLSEPFTVTHFQKRALPIIDRLLDENKSPIIVGGTNYYIESLLWKNLVHISTCPVATLSDMEPQSVTRTFENSTDDFDQTTFHPPTSSPSESLNLEQIKMEKIPSCLATKDTTMTQSLLTKFSANEISELDPQSLNVLTTDVLHAKLKIFDPISANRIHPNNRRKILRALEIFYNTGGIPMSKFFEEQRNQPGGNRLGGPLRYPHTILLWLRCNQEILNQRLEKRIDSMLEQGLLPEVRNFYDKNFKKIQQKQLTKGILQSIGFKEFLPYLEKYDSLQDSIIENYLKANSYILTEKALENEPAGIDLLRNCLEELKLVTKRYSKRQLKWVKNRFLSSKDRLVPPLYALDTSDISKWKENVQEVAIDIVQSYVDEKTPIMSSLEKFSHQAENFDLDTSHYCEICKRHFVGGFQWSLHMKSNKHKRTKESARKRQKLEENAVKILE